MANVKITELTELAAVDVADNDVVPIVDVGGDTTKKVTAASLRTSIAEANDFITYTVLNSNLDIVSSNADAYLVQLNANIDVVQSNVDAQNSYITSTYATLLLLDSVQDNVASAESNVAALRVEYLANVASTEANVNAVESRRVANTFFTYNTDSNVIITDANVEPSANNTYSLGAPDLVWKDIYLGPGTLFIGNVTIAPNETGSGLTITGADASTTTIDTATSNVTASLNLLQDNVAAAESNVVSAETRLNANLDIVQDNVATLTTTVDNFGTSSNSNAASLAAGIVASEVRVNANLDLTNDNVANITDGTTPFSAPVTFTDNVIISGSLIVTGAQVDLGVQSATVDNNFIELSAELSPGDAPATDSGLLINRGNKGNVFIGDHLGEDGVIFVRTQTPDTNTIIAIESFMDLHGNNFHAAADVNLQRVHFGLRASEDTGIIVDDAGANINFIVDGGYVANVHYDGTLNSQNAIIAPAVFADGVELQANDSATLFSARANDFATFTHITANVDIVQDNVAQNATDISAVEARRAANIAGAVSTITTSDLTASRALASDGSGKVAVSAVTSTELGYLDGVTSAIQTQLDSKSSTANAASLAAGIATKLDSADYTASDVLTKIKTVDGAGSGLDADLLDGQSSAYYAVEATRSSNAAALAAGIAGITPIGTSDISDNAVTVGKLAATLDLGAL